MLLGETYDRRGSWGEESRKIKYEGSWGVRSRGEVRERKRRSDIVRKGGRCRSCEVTKWKEVVKEEN